MIFMAKTINQIIKDSEDLHFIKIIKPSRERNSWRFECNDPTSKLSGISGNLKDYQYKISTLQRGHHYFLAYKIYVGESYEYYVDPKKSIHRTSTKKYVDSFINHIILSNDISYLKNSPSFKYSKQEMISDGISNYLDLCVHFGEYSSIGTGLTRDIRNLLVMDIDVNCEKSENKKELERLIIAFSSVNFTPDFLIFNHESKHVQLQWLIQDCKYKEVNKNFVNKKIDELEQSENKHREINIFDFNFTDISQDGTDYRMFTKALTYLSDKYKFGDKNYTFWKAKNFYSALLGKFNLELMMPYVKDNEIHYLDQEYMESLFATKESRQTYFDASPSLSDVYEKTKTLIAPVMGKVSEASVKKIKDGSDISFKEIKSEKNIDKDGSEYGESRNDFVFQCTREMTWEIARRNNFKDKTDIKKLSENKFKSFKSSVKKEVKNLFNIENEKYGGLWPGTTNHSKYTSSEFNLTFNSSFEFAVDIFINKKYTDEQRNDSIYERKLKSNLRLMVVDYLTTNYKKLKRKELLDVVNDLLTESKQRPISNTSLKRDLHKLSEYDDQMKKKLYKSVLNELDGRKDKLNKLINDGNDKKEINILKKKMNRLGMNMNVLDEIRKSIEP